VPDRVSLLQKLAAVAIDSPAGRESLVRVVDLIRDALGAEQVFLVYAEDVDPLICSDSQSEEKLDTNQMGLWLVGHQIEIAGGPVAFNIEEGRVCDIAPARDAEAPAYLGFSVASSEGSGEMLIIRTGHSSAAVPSSNLFAFVEAAAPAVTVVLDHVLGVARANRQREQMMALANAAELLIQAEHIKPVLEDLATAISRTSGYDLVTIDIYDSESEMFTVSVINRAPQVETSLGERWKQQAEGSIYPEAVLRTAIAQREPLLFADLQSDERIPEYGHEFFRRAHIFSAGQFPITFHDQFLGVLRVASQRPRGFPPREVDVLSSFAAQLAVALEAVEMYKSLAESERQLKRYAEELQASMEVQHRLARTDPLTGVPNRRYVDEIVRGECPRAARHKTPLSVALVDVDFFKEVNDTYGHKAGDEALVQLGDLARRSCRRGDVVGRYGGDEFLFVLPKADLRAALKFANRFRANVANHVFSLSPEASTRMTVSAGVAGLDPEIPEKPSALIKQADEALYEAKAKGRNRTASARASRRRAA
jgi:diguanylate cyclase (GGDEF)-like protein